MTDKPTQILVRISGGLGNQLFQLVAGLHLAQKLAKAEIKLDLRFLSNYQSPRSFELDFLLKYFSFVSAHQEGLGFLGVVSKLRIARLLKTQLFGTALVSDQKSLDYINFSKLKYAVLDGYFQDPKLLMTTTLKATLFQKLKMDYEYLKTKTSNTNLDKKVSIHIRRGDYVSSPAGIREFLTIDLDYYRKAIQKFPCDTLFYVFGDDAELVESFAKEINAVNVPDLKLTLQEEFVLMADSTGYIIANSTLSWWAAFLGYSEGKRVISPSKWFVDDVRNQVNGLQLDYFELV